MKSITFNGITYSEITYRMDGEDMEGLLIHDERDINRDGDMIVGNGCQLPESAEDAEIILVNETGITDFRISDDGICII